MIFVTLVYLALLVWLLFGNTDMEISDEFGDREGEK